VVIPCFNQRAYVGAAIESVLAQTYANIEVVVVDDGSDDGSAELIRSHRGVRYVRQENAGLARARNTGLEASTGAFVVFLDADDWLLPRAVELGIRTLADRPDCMFAAGHYVYLLPTGEHVSKPVVPLVQGTAYRELLRARDFGIAHGGSVVYRRAVFDAVGAFDPRWDAAADYDLYLRIARVFPVCAHTEPVAVYRGREDSMSNDPELMLRAVVAVHAEQRPFVAGDRDLTAAYDEGIRFWREYYSWQCLRAARHDLRARRLRRATFRSMRASRALLPYALRRFVRGTRRTSVVAAATSTEQLRDVDRGQSRRQILP
jgi:glycosyltransferase involved in cell wall biosynthesis